jgi:hypothetical protein
MPLPEQGAIDIAAGPVSDQWTVQWDPESRTPLRMSNRSLQEETPPGSEPVSEAVALEALRAVVAEHLEWFRLRPGVDDLRLVRGRAEGWLRVIRVEQTYKGVPVAGAGYEARVLPTGRVGSMEGRLHPDLEMSVTPVLSPQLAEDRAHSAFVGRTSPPAYPQLQFEWQHAFDDARALAIIPRDGRFTLAWGVVIRTPPSSTRVFVDATSGTVVGYQIIGTAWR